MGTLKSSSLRPTKSKRIHICICIFLLESYFILVYLAFRHHRWVVHFLILAATGASVPTTRNIHTYRIVCLFIYQIAWGWMDLAL